MMGELRDAFSEQHSFIPSLQDLSLKCIAKYFSKYRDLYLPDDLTTKLIHLLNKKRKLDDNSIIRFINPNIQILDLANCQSVKNVSLIVSRCPHIRTLILRGCLTVSDSTLLSIAASCANLQSLSLTYNKKISDHGVMSLVKVCTNIQYLDLSWCTRITDESLKQISISCIYLKEFSASNCKLVTGIGINALSQNCSILTKLELRCCSSITHLEIKSSSIRNLNVGSCTALLDSSLRTIQCENLRDFSINSCPKISDISLQNFLSIHTALENLNISGCNLQGLDFRCKNLKILIASSNPFKSPTSFGILSKNCENLQKIDLKGSPNISDEYIDLLTSSTTISYPPFNHPIPASYLEYIFLARCELITDKSILYISQRCIKLRELDISWCPKITDQALSYLEQQHKKLSYLRDVKIFGCSNITNSSILSLHKAFESKLHVKAITDVRDYLMIDSI